MVPLARWLLGGVCVRSFSISVSTSCLVGVFVPFYRPCIVRFYCVCVACVFALNNNVDLNDGLFCTDYVAALLQLLRWLNNTVGTLLFFSSYGG